MSDDKGSSDSIEDQKPSVDLKYVNQSSDSRCVKREDDFGIAIPSGKYFTKSCTISVSNYVLYMRKTISDDPIIKQEQLDEIDAPSFTPKSFKSTKSDVKVTSQSLITDLHIANNNGSVDLDEDKQISETEKRKNDTVFHDSVCIIRIVLNLELFSLKMKRTKLY